MTDFESTLDRLGLHQYHEAFVAEGFDAWETVLDIQETDLESLNVKLGHRRRLQRAIAEYRGIASDRPLVSPSRDVSTIEKQKPDLTIQQTGQKDTSSTGEQKRKYRRHPKPDENAPEKPPSAYVLFSNRVREEIRSESLTFTEIARLVGERWQKLEPVQKDSFDSHATTLKDMYNIQLADYKKTDAYRHYMEYLNDFKAKHSAATTSEAKRPKLESQHSSSLGSVASQTDLVETLHQATGHARGGSIGSASAAPLSASPASSVHLVSSLPGVTPAGVHISFPTTQASREKSFVGTLSTQTSISDEAHVMRLDSSETVPRAGQLASGLVTRTSPPLLPLSTSSTRLAQRDYSGSGPQFQQWPARQSQPGVNRLLQAQTTSLASETPMTISAGTTGLDDRPERSTVIHRHSYPTLPGLPPQHHPVSMAAPHLTDSLASSELTAPPRLLPPLRQFSSHPSNAASPSSIFVTPPALSPVSHQPPPDKVPVWHAQQGNVPDISESEAANTLAGLAVREWPFNAARNPGSTYRRRA